MTTAALSSGCSRLVAKPWGSELIFTEPGLPYVGKIISVHAGRRLSLQVHDTKTETLTVLSGVALLILEDADGALQEIAMKPGTGYTVFPGRSHRLCALTDAVVSEVSTPEVGVTYRLEDDYNRPDDIRQRS